MNSKKKTKLTKVLRFLPMILVMAGIFFFSAMQGEESSDTSEGLLDAFIRLFGSRAGELSENTYRTLHLLIRKAAHFTEYALLGTSACFALGVPRKRNAVIQPDASDPIGSDKPDRSIRQYILPWLIATLYAVTDEIHQYFVPNRYGTWSDVLIDSAGAVTGILIYSIIVRRHYSKKAGIA